MNDKDIKLGISVEGADQSVAEIKKVTDAAEATKDLEKKAGVEQRRAADDAKRAELETEVRRRIASDGIAKAADQLRGYGQVIRESAGSLRGLSGEQKRFLESTGEAIEGVSSFVGAAAEGYSRGGPIGALIGAAVDGVGKIYRAWSQTDQQIEKSMESMRKAAEMNRQLAQLKITLPLALAAEEASKKLDEAYQPVEKARESPRPATNRRAPRPLG